MRSDGVHDELLLFVFCPFDLRFLLFVRFADFCELPISVSFLHFACDFEGDAVSMIIIAGTLAEFVLILIFMNLIVESHQIHQQMPLRSHSVQHSAEQHLLKGLSTTTSPKSFC